MGLEFGLGAEPSPFDQRDYPITAAPPVAALTLPTSLTISPLPPNLNQGGTPQCVAFSQSAHQAWMDRPEDGRWSDFDEDWMYRLAKTRDGIPESPGTFPRVVLEIRRKIGFRTVGHRDEAEHMLDSYYRVPLDVDAIRETLASRGPVLIVTEWPRSWFETGRDGVLPKPTGGLAGYHATWLSGYNDRRATRAPKVGAFLDRNSWSRRWGSLGNFWLPYRWLDRATEAWWAKDKEVKA